MNPETIASQLKFQGAVFTVRTDRVQWQDGRQASYDVVEHPGSVTLIPVDDSDRIWFVRQYRHPIRRTVLELPAGTLDDGESAQDCAARECREEIGMRAGELSSLGQVLLAPGYSSEACHLFLARDLQPAPLPPDEDEDLAVEKWTVDEVLDMVGRGDLEDAKSLAALWLALPYISEAD